MADDDVPAWAVAAATDLPSKDPADPPGFRTIVGFGSLLSEESARSTCPALQNFRLGRVDNYRRVFAHPAGIFFARGIASLATKEMASLSAELAEGCSFRVSLFEVEDSAAAMARFVQREEEFDLVMAPYVDDVGRHGTALMCARGTDEMFVSRAGREVFERDYVAVGVDTIWRWGHDSGILPCRVYCRHCVLAAAKQGDDVRDAFLDTTFLADRSTTLREHLERNPSIMHEEPPPALKSRYSG